MYHIFWKDIEFEWIHSTEFCEILNLGLTIFLVDCCFKKKSCILLFCAFFASFYYLCADFKKINNLIIRLYRYTL